ASRRRLDSSTTTATTSIPTRSPVWRSCVRGASTSASRATRATSSRSGSEARASRSISSRPLPAGASRSPRPSFSPASAPSAASRRARSRTSVTASTTTSSPRGLRGCSRCTCAAGPGATCRIRPGPTSAWTRWPSFLTDSPPMPELRVGIGVDAHALEDGVPLDLGGVSIDHPRGLAGHSDGDVLAHALTDAVLGAAGLEDIGALFSSGDPALKGADSVELLRRAWEQVQAAGWRLANADVVLIGEEPRLAPHRDAMRARLAEALGVEPERVAVRATTTDRLGFTGRGEGLAAHAVALLER